MYTKARVFLSTLFLFVIAFATALYAQVGGSSFTGRVTDSTGAVIGKAKVTVHNAATNTDRSVGTSSAGVYSLPFLLPGQYSLTAEAPGFKQEKRVGLVLQADSAVTVDFALQVGDVKETVTVTANDLLNRGSASTGTTIGHELVKDLPLVGGNAVMLYRQAAGVFYNGMLNRGGLSYQRPFDGAIYDGLNVNGGNARGAGWNNLAMLDGVPNMVARTQNAQHNDTASIMNNDAVQEVTVVTNAYDASYGRTRNGVVDITTKSGTNSLHGSVYYNYRRGWTNANTFRNNTNIITDPTQPALGQPGRDPSVPTNYVWAPIARQPYTLDQPGFELDGPVILPKLYNGRDKTFFLLTYENWHEYVPQGISQSSIPDPKWATTGDFNSSMQNGYYSTIYNPFDTYTPTSKKTGDPDCGNYTCRRQFGAVNSATAGSGLNVVPQSYWNPVAVKLLALYPQNPTPAANTNNPQQSNWLFMNNWADTYRNAYAKLSHVLTPKDRLGFSYGWWERYETTPGNGLPGIAHGQAEFPLGERNHTFTSQWTHTFTPTLLLDFRANLLMKEVIAGSSAVGYDLQKDMGWTDTTTIGLINSYSTYNQMPNVQINGAAGGAGFTQMSGGQEACKTSML